MNKLPHKLHSLHLLLVTSLRLVPSNSEDTVDGLNVSTLNTSYLSNRNMSKMLKGEC